MSTEINIGSGSSGSVTSVDLTMPSAFNVSGNPITSAGTLAVTGAGSVSEYVRGDGSLASFPSTTGGGASVNYYLNGGTNQGTFSGNTYYQASKTAVVGSSTTFSVVADGYIASFITDAGDPNKLLIPSGNWNCSLYFVASTNTGNPKFYVELYKYDGAAFTLIASSASNPKEITGGTTLDSYTTTLAVPQTVLILTDRLAFRVYVVTSGNTITLNTQGDTLCQVVTTFTTGLTALNGLTDQVQFLATGTSGTNFNISSVGNTHTLNLPTASALNRGALSASDWTNFNSKLSNLTINSTPITGGISGNVLFQNAGLLLSNGNLSFNTTLGRLSIAQGASPAARLDIKAADTISTNNAVRVSNDTNTKSIFNISNSGQLTLSHPTLTGDIFIETTATNNHQIRTSGIGVVFQFGPTNIINTSQSIVAARRISVTSTIEGIGFNVTSLGTFTTGVNDVSSIVITNSVNHSGTYTGVARGFYYNPSSVTYTGPHRAIETVRGDVVFGSTSGSTLIGTTTNAGFKLDVNGTARVQGNITQTGAGNTATFANGFLFNVDASPRLFCSTTIQYQSNATTTQHRFTNQIGVGLTGTLVQIDSGSFSLSNPVSFLKVVNQSVELLNLKASGNLLLGTTTDVSSSLLTLESTTKGFLPPRMTTVQRTAIATPVAGLIVYDTTANKHYGYDGTNWNAFY